MAEYDELGRIWKKAGVAYLRFYPGVCLGGLRKTNLGCPVVVSAKSRTKHIPKNKAFIITV
jgi:hypothetical protein